MIEYGDTLDVRHGPDDKERDVMCKTINSIFGELLGLKFGYEDLQCLTQRELYSFIQSSENLKKLYHAKIIDINPNDNKDKVKHNLRMDIEYIKPVVEKYGTNDKLFDTILYANDLLEQWPRRKIEITDLLELMDFFSEHMIDKAKFGILKKLSEYRDFTPMNIKYMVIAVEKYLNGKKGDIPSEINYEKIKKESILLESRDKGAWIDCYGNIIPLNQCGCHDGSAENIILGDKFLSERLSEYKGNDYREFLVQECGWVKFTGKKFFLKFTELERANSCFSFPINPITNRPRITHQQSDAIFDICGSIPKELVQ